MQAIAQRAVATLQGAALPAPRIKPIHDPVDRQHSDLVFSVETGGRPFRVLVARDAALFAPDQAGARNASNFYDSQREGLQHDDGPPTFYLVPRSVVHAMLPATRLYYTVIAYADDAGRDAIYGHPPESLAREAPFVSLAADLDRALAFMFGTPVAHLLRVNGTLAQQLAEEEIGEDLEADLPETIGLAEDDEESDEGLSEAAAFDAQEDEPDEAAALDADPDFRQPAMEDTQASALEEDVSAALSNDYDDGYGLPPASVPHSQASAEAQSAQGDYGAEHDSVPETLPDEEAEGAHASQASDREDDEVEVEGEAQSFDAPPALPRRPLDIEACKAILARIMPFESGNEGYSRVIEDGEFAGRFGTAHPAYNRYHLGLTFGAFPFCQEHGTLGQLLQLMRERDPATFDATFPQGDELIAVTTAADGARAWESPDGFSPRLAPVAGQRLWQQPWIDRFKRAGKHPAFQGAQNELAARLYIEPVRTVARQVGLDSDQALTLVVDRAVQMGAQAGLAWVLEAATPVETTALRQRALASLGHADLQGFQTAQRLPATGLWDVATHAALIAALRTHPNSPTPVLGREEVVAAMLRHAQGTPWAERMKRLRDTTSADRLFEL